MKKPKVGGVFELESIYVENPERRVEISETKNTVREPGFYWVRSKEGEWEIAEWWIVSGSEGAWCILDVNEDDIRTTDSDFDQIGPRILPPDLGIDKVIGAITLATALHPMLSDGDIVTFEGYCNRPIMFSRSWWKCLLLGRRAGFPPDCHKLCMRRELFNRRHLQ